MFKNENGFSLVELAIAAGLAVALAATAVTILSGTTASLSSKANGAAGTSSQYNTDVLANASGAAGSSNNNGGSSNPAPLIAPVWSSFSTLDNAEPLSYNFDQRTSSMTISWEPVSGATSYIVNSGGFSGTISGETYTIPSIPSGTSVEVSVIAVTANGNTPAVSRVFTASPSVSSISNLNNSYQDMIQIGATPAAYTAYTAPLSVTYDFEYSTSASGPWTSASGQDGSSSTFVTGLQADTTYYFRVKATNGNTAYYFDGTNLGARQTAAVTTTSDVQAISTAPAGKGK